MVDPMLTTIVQPLLGRCYSFEPFNAVDSQLLLTVEVDLRKNLWLEFFKSFSSGIYYGGVMRCLPFLCGGSGNKPDSGNPPNCSLRDLSVARSVNFYTYKELKLGTDGFSLENKVGEGGFGSVYKAKLRNGEMAAVKVQSSDSKQGVKEFLTEIRVISKADHENLVKLYGCCVEGDHRILVYNYLENNSLSQKLLGEKCIRFDWPMRVKICLGVAKGIAYLHEEMRPHIIHRDIKASNVLLDKDMNPKISDFGLAKLIPPNKTHVSTRVAGTIFAKWNLKSSHHRNRRGYLAPEYAMRGQVTRRSDVYSFGVLLMEIVSGRCNTNRRLPRDEHYLLDMAWQLYQKDELSRLVDSSLDEGNVDADRACRFLKIGLLCTQDDPNLRPAMSAVVRMLAGDEALDEKGITEPGLISDIYGVRVIRKCKEKTRPDSRILVAESPDSNSSEVNSFSFGGTYSQATMSVTAICDRSP
ncbi:hypothetical protein M569_12029 [Genlisea aurea]|uniref:Protein kinase domain-containing protein n=1 Tax=Genlisea aurea TaxID=192259 RepID=S8C7J5_9LAMI|nr:hypothetical protein M569_12029 [Genlisea aurea]